METSLAAGYKCAGGWDCIRGQVVTSAPLKCSDGMLCPGGPVGKGASMMWCVEGSYCPSSGPALGRALPCPEGSFCPSAMSAPIACPVGSSCPEGSRVYTQFLYLAIVAPVILGVFGMLAWTTCAGRVRRLANRRSRRAGADAGSGHKTDAEGSRSRPAPPIAPFKASDPEGGLKSGIISTEFEEPELHIRFERLSVAVREKGKEKKVILKSVSGVFRPGQVTAVMGSSGAGKSTLVNVILGKLPQSSGRILVNGAEQAIARYGRLMGFVPQDDVLLRALTVRETLEHSAATRLPVGTTPAERDAIIERAMDALQLRGIASRLVGDELRKGLSRSERKRVSIAVELVACPRVLFLDEPTTGLDARSSQELANALRRIASTGVTVVAVLHQPRFEILQLCNEVLLLGKGGFTAFQGTPERALRYFQELGYELREGTNPADLFLDVLSCRAEREAIEAPAPAAPAPSAAPAPAVVLAPGARGALAAPPAGPRGSRGARVATTLEFLEKAARERGVISEDPDPPAPAAGAGAQGVPPPSPPPCSRPVAVGREWWARTVVGETLGAYLSRRLLRRGAGASPSVRVTPGFWRQLPLYFARSLRETLHDPTYAAIGVVSVLIAGGSMAAGFDGRVAAPTVNRRYLPRLPAEVVAACPLVVRGRCAAEATLGQVPYYLGFYLTMILGAIFAVAAVPTFGDDRRVYSREVAAGCSPAAIFAAKAAFDVLNILVRSFIFCAFFALMIGAPSGFWRWFGIVFPLCWCAYGVGYMASCLVRRERASIVAAVAGVASVVTSGLSPSLAQVKDRYGPMQILWWISFNRWSAEGMVILSVSDYAARGFDVAGPLAAQGYDNGNYYLAVLAPMLLGLSHRFVAFGLLRLADYRAARK